jgi:hypothetical protein
MKWFDGDVPGAEVRAALPAIKKALTERFGEKVRFSESDFGWTVAAAVGRRGVYLTHLYYVDETHTKNLSAEESDIPDIIGKLEPGLREPMPERGALLPSGDGTLDGNEEPL